MNNTDLNKTIRLLEKQLKQVFKFKRKERTGKSRVLQLAEEKLDYLKRQTMPNLVSEFIEVFNTSPIIEDRDYLIQLVARDYQRKTYITLLGSVPELVLKQDTDYEKFGLAVAVIKAKEQLRELQKPEIITKPTTFNFWH